VKMGRYWKLMAQYDAEATTYAACGGGTSGAASPYTPTEDARLVGLRVITSEVAVTTVQNGIQFKLTCSTFKPNSIEVAGNGSGLYTAPMPGDRGIDWTVDQPVNAGVPIVIEARHVGAYAAVTAEACLWGCFEN
jgi:hypothetical protein